MSFTQKSFTNGKYKCVLSTMKTEGKKTKYAVGFYTKNFSIRLNDYEDFNLKADDVCDFVKLKDAKYSIECHLAGC